MPPFKPIFDRFSEKYKVDHATNCWNWTGSRLRNSYGMISLGLGANNIPAHRFSYQHFIGEIPDGMIVRHTCDNPSCVNPEHLVLGTHADNMRDMASRGGRLGRGTGSTLPKNVLRRMKSLLQRGETQQRTADILGVARTTVQRVIGRGDLDFSSAPKPQWSRKPLGTDVYGEIRRLLALNKNISEVAVILGVDRKTVRNVRDGNRP